MEINKEVKIEEKKSNLVLESRKKLSINGVIEIVSFNEDQILLNTTVGNMIIKGENLKMHKLDVQNGDVNISGKINSCMYTTNESKKNKDSIISRLLK